MSVLHPLSDLQIECSLCQTPNIACVEMEKPIPEFMHNYKCPRIVNIILKKRSKVEVNHTSYLQNLLQSFSNQNYTEVIPIPGMRLDTNKERNQQNRIESRNKPIHLWPIDFQQGYQDNSTNG